MRECSPPQKKHVTSHVSHVTCHVSHVLCHISHDNFYLFINLFFSDKVVKFSGGGSVINRAYPVQFLGACHHFLVSATEVPEIVLVISSISEVMSEQKVGFGAFFRLTKGF